MFGLPRASNRVAFPPDYRDDDLGFRCARDP
jgi:formylglycine-generating enzyme required for sulfatase activity